MHKTVNARLEFATEKDAKDMLGDALMGGKLYKNRNSLSVRVYVLLELTDEEHLEVGRRSIVWGGMPPTTTSKGIPDNERWLHQPEVAQRVASAIEWAETHAARTDNADAILDAVHKAD